MFPPQSKKGKVARWDAQIVEKPLPTHHLYAANGDAWDDTVERYYLVEDFEGGGIVI